MYRGVASSGTILASVYLLLFLFTIASARYLFDSSGIFDIDNDIDHSYHDSLSVSEKNPADSNANILLPTEKPVLKISDSKTPEPRAETTESSEATDPDPFTVLSFRSIYDPRIPRRPLPLSFLLGHRCHHNHHYKPWKPRLPRRERSMAVERSELLRRIYNRHRHCQHRHELDNKDATELMKRIRKFLKNF